MAWFLFIDESGQDRRESPYEVLAGVAVEDEKLWGLVKDLHNAEIAHFGRRYSDGSREIKGKKILKRKVFSHLNIQLNDPIIPNEVPILAKEILDNGGVNASRRHQKALAQAKVAYVSDVFSICQSHDCKIFASVVEQDAPQTVTDGLRKDYGYLFQRFFYFLEDCTEASQGVLVFDELEKSKSHILIDQAHRYFKGTHTGRHRSSLIIPEPFFVHSDLTTGIQIADLVAYCISWAYRLTGMTKPVRSELSPYIVQIRQMERRAIRSIHGNDSFVIYSICRIQDLRTHAERVDD